jgi:CheY-like chemotaxis protein
MAPKRVLIVDDDPEVLETLTVSLEDRYDVAVAANGRDALRSVLAAHFDAIVLDLMMPIMNGEAFVRELAARKLEIPVVLASASDDLRARAAALRVADHIEKPFDIDRLLRKIEGAISLRP